MRDTRALEETFDPNENFAFFRSCAIKGDGHSVINDPLETRAYFRAVRVHV